MSKRIKLVIDIQFRDKNREMIGIKEINVSTDVKVEFIERAIRDRFGTDQNVALLTSNANRRIKSSEVIAGYLQNEERLICRLIQSEKRTPEQLRNELSKGRSMEVSVSRIYFEDTSTLDKYPVKRFPALIGRSDRAGEPSAQLAVDLSVSPDGQSISRKHALLTEQDGVFHIEALKENNPVILNGVRLRHNVSAVLNAGDTVRVGKITLKFHVVA